MPAPSSPTIAMQVSEADGALTAVPVAPSPLQRGWVRVAVTASGVCRADIATARARGADGPVTPGHEIAGAVVELGEGVVGWTTGDRAVVGWFGGSCGHCAFCRRGDVVHCAERMTPGLSYPGGWAQSIAVPADALARIPDGLDDFDAAPLGCAGVTTFNAIRRATLPANARIAVFGIGGLGHLAVQFAARMGYEVVAIARGLEREALARELGAHHYIDSSVSAAGVALCELGGADLILSTASSTGPVGGLLDGLRVGGRLTLVGADGGTVTVPAARLVMNGQTLTGHLTGSALDIEETMRFALSHGVRPMIERMPLIDADEAVRRLEQGRARFRIVLDAGARR